MTLATHGQSWAISCKLTNHLTFKWQSRAHVCLGPSTRRGSWDIGFHRCHPWRLRVVCLISILRTELWLGVASTPPCYLLYKSCVCLQFLMAFGSVCCAPAWLGKEFTCLFVSRPKLRRHLNSQMTDEQPLPAEKEAQAITGFLSSASLAGSANLWFPFI